MATNAQQVARWMLSEFEKAGELYQSDAVDGIEREFGPDFIYDNDLGNQAIDRTVLVAFRKLTEGNVVWNTVLSSAGSGRLQGTRDDSRNKA